MTVRELVTLFTRHLGVPVAGHVARRLRVGCLLERNAFARKAVEFVELK